MQIKNITQMFIVSTFVIANFICLKIVVAGDKYIEASLNNTNNGSGLLTIEKAITRAINFNPSLQSAISKVDAAEGMQIQASLLPNPEIMLEAENFGGNDDLSGTNSAEYTLSVYQKIELGGKRDARKKVADASYAIAQEDLSIERLNTIKEVHIAYTNVLLNTESLMLAIEQEELAKDILSNVTKRVQSAVESDIQQSKAEVTLANSLILREQNNRKLQIARHRLSKLWGDSSFKESLDNKYLFELKKPTDLNECLERIDTLPELQKLIHQSNKMYSILGLAQSEKVVDPIVSVGVRRFEEGSDNAFLVGVSIPLQIFDKNQGNIAIAQAESLEALSDAQQFELNLRQALFDNWQTWNSSYMEATHIKSQLIPAAEQSLQSSLSAYKKGRFSYLEVLDAQRTLIDARNQYLNTLSNFHTAQINVKRLTNSFGE